jgi:hypothetical protein
MYAAWTAHMNGDHSAAVDGDGDGDADMVAVRSTG